jgi:hypothetical protein
MGKYLAPGLASFNYLLDRYVRQAKSRDLPFELTKGEFIGLLIQDCSYCGTKPKPFNSYVTGQSFVQRNKRSDRNPEAIARSWINVNSIDRMDNSIGYIPKNCVTACVDCNEMKMNRTLEEFFNHIKLIANKQSFKIAERITDELV